MSGPLDTPSPRGSAGAGDARTAGSASPRLDNQPHEQSCARASADVSGRPPREDAVDAQDKPNGGRARAKAAPAGAPPRRGEVLQPGEPGAEALLSPTQVATMCGLSRRAVYRAIERGELVASRVCSRLRIHPADVADWLHHNRVEPATASSPQPSQPPPPPRARGSLRSMLSQGEGTP